MLIFIREELLLLTFIREELLLLTCIRKGLLLLICISYGCKQKRIMRALMYNTPPSFNVVWCIMLATVKLRPGFKLVIG